MSPSAADAHGMNASVINGRQLGPHVGRQLSPSTADAHSENASVVDGISSPVGRLAMTSLVVRMPVEDGPGGGSRRDES